MIVETGLVCGGLGMKNSIFMIYKVLFHTRIENILKEN